jgi:ribosomal protein L13
VQVDAAELVRMKHKKLFKPATFNNGDCYVVLRCEDVGADGEYSVHAR